MMIMMMMMGWEEKVEKEEEEKELIFISYWLNVLFLNHWDPTWRSSSLNNWMEVSTFCLGVQVLSVTPLYRIYWWRRKVQQRLWGCCIHQLAGHPQVLILAQRGRWLVHCAASMSSWKCVPGWWPHSCWTQSSLFSGDISVLTNISCHVRTDVASELQGEPNTFLYSTSMLYSQFG